MATGGARWAVPGEPLGGSPDLAVVRDPSPSAAVIHAVDAATGEARWEADVSGDVDTAVGLGSGDADADVVVLPAGVSLVAYDASSGVLRWHRPLPAGLDASTSPQVLLVDGTAVLVDSATGSGLTGFDAATGDQRWAITSSPPSFLLPDADAIYLQPPAQNQPGFGRLDPDTGEPRWSVAAPAALYQGYGGSGMAAVATDMWPMTTTAAVDAIDAETGAVR